jgi:hypothetical protein
MMYAFLISPVLATSPPLVFTSPMGEVHEMNVYWGGHLFGMELLNVGLKVQEEVL